MAKKKLRPGKGAKAQVLTRFIKPTQPLLGDDKKASSRDRTASWTLSCMNPLELLVSTDLDKVFFQSYSE
jgi:hypothetical protein